MLRLFERLTTGLQRDKIVVDIKSPSYRKEPISKNLEISLKEPDTDNADIWQLHARDEPASTPDGALEAMQLAGSCPIGGRLMKTIGVR